MRRASLASIAILLAACSKAGAPKAAPVAVGSKVMAFWGEAFFEAKVLSACEGGWNVEASGEQRCSATAEVVASTPMDKPAAGARVLALWGQEQFYPGTVTSVSGDTATVTWDDGSGTQDVAVKDLRVPTEKASKAAGTKAAVGGGAGPFKVWKGSSVFGEFEANGKVWVDNRQAGELEPDGKVWRGGSKVGEIEPSGRIWVGSSQFGEIEPSGKLWYGSSKVGEIEPGGRIWLGSSQWGEASGSGCCKTPEDRRRLVAFLVFFTDFGR